MPSFSIFKPIQALKLGGTLGRLVLALVFLAQNVVFLHATDGTLWTERRRALEAALKKSPEIDKVAKLPGPSLQALLPAVQTAPLGGMPAVLNPLPSARAPAGFVFSAGELEPWLKSVVGGHGNVQEVRLPPRADKLVVFIQDVHESPEAQFNTARMLDGLAAASRRAGETPAPPLVGLEAAADGFDWEPYRRLASPAVIKSAGEVLVRQGLMSGAEYFGLTAAPDAAVLRGVEDAEAYLANVRALSESLRSESGEEAAAAPVRAAMKALKAAHFGSDLRDLDEKMGAYARGELGLGRYVRALSEKVPAEKAGANVRRFLQALDLEEKLDFKRVESERVRLIETLVENLMQADLEHLLKTSLTYRLGQTTYREYYDYLRGVCSTNAVPIKDFGQLDSYIRYVLTAEQIDREKLLEELERLESAALAARAVTETQRTLVRLTRDLALAEKLKSFSLSDEEWTAYEARREELARLPARLAALGAAGKAAEASAAAFRELLERHEAFYRAARRRNETMVANLLKSSGGRKLTAVVAGGFHAPGMRDLLLAEGVGYASLTPRLGDVSAIPHYLDAFRPEKTSLDKLFAGERIFLRKELLWAGSVPSGSTADRFKAQGFLAGAAVAQTLGEMIRAELAERLPPGEPLDLDGAEAYLGQDFADRIAAAAAEMEKNAAGLKGPLKGLAVGLSDVRIAPHAGKRGVHEVTVPVRLIRSDGEEEAEVSFQVTARFEPPEESTESKGLSFKTGYGSLVFSPVEPGGFERLVRFVRDRLSLRWTAGEAASPFASRKAFDDALPGWILDLIGRRRADVEAALADAKALEAVTDKINVAPLPGELSGVQPDVLEDFLAGQDGEDYRKRARDGILRGRVVMEFIFAGAATRLGLGPMYGADLKAVADVIAGRPAAVSEAVRKRILQKVAELPEDVRTSVGSAAAEGGPLFNLGLGTRQILQYRLELERLAREAGEDPGALLARTPLVVHVNEEVWEDVRRDFVENGFFGFDPANVLFVEQPVYRGYRYEDGALELNEASDALPLGHGHGLLQLAQAGEAVRLDAAGRPAPVEGSVIDELERRSVQALVAHRINDMTMWTGDVLDADRVAMMLHAMDRGHNVVVELVGNPGKQKGGNAIRHEHEGVTVDMLIETSNTKGSERLTAFLDERAKQGAPYNAFRNGYKLSALRELLSDGLPANLRYKNGHFYVELVSGDVTQKPAAKAVFFQKSGELIHDFKEFKNLPEALAYLAAQDAQPEMQARAAAYKPPRAGAFHAGSVARVLARGAAALTELLARATHEAVTAGLATVYTRLQALQGALYGGEEAVVAALEQLDHGARMLLLHEIAVAPGRRLPWEGQERALEAALAGLVDRFEPVPGLSTENARVYAVTHRGRTEKVRFLLSRVPSFWDRTDDLALGTIRGPTLEDDVSEVALQDVAFELDSSALRPLLSELVEHEIEELFMVLDLVPPAEAHRAVTESQPGVVERFREALAARERPKRFWAVENAPELEGFSVVSLQFEAGLDRGLLEKLDRHLAKREEQPQGPGRLARLLKRQLAQLNMTGGLGALMHDLVSAWRKNGSDVVAIHPLYDDKVKGVLATQPQLRPGETLGDVIRESGILRKTAMSFTVVLRDDEFARRANAQKAREALGKAIRVDVYEGRTKFGEAPLYYLDAYYEQDGRRVRVFDEVYPDNDYRVVHMALYNEAAQRLTGLLRQKGVLREDLLFVENEVFVSLPKNHFPEAVRHHINHTVWKPGMYRPPAYAYELLGFDPAVREDVFRGDRIDVAEYAAQTADVVTGVGLYEHTPVLKSGVFPLYTHKVAGYARDGLRNTNGALFDQWQGTEVRKLIDLFARRLGVDALAGDAAFFAELQRDGRAKAEFVERLEMTKALYALDLLFWLAETQPQAMGGGSWLLSLAAELGTDPAGLRARRERMNFLLQRSFAREDAWKDLAAEFGGLKDKVLANPMAANVRRQVPYKGPDKYEELLYLFTAADVLATAPGALEAFERMLRGDGWLKSDWGALDPRLGRLKGAVLRQVLAIPESDRGRRDQKAADLRAKLAEQVRAARADPGALERFRASGTRLVIGGRTFDAGARALFETLRDAAGALGLESRFAFIEDYNIDDAPVIFRGVSAAVMLSDEFLEASATSMMKAITNGAALIGVWGGADPELFDVRRADGSAVDALTDGLTHDGLAAGLKDGSLAVRNGFLVEYAGGELSREEMGGRRPSAASLLSAFTRLGQGARDPSARGALLFDTLASSPRVDIERSQARAHIKMWQAAVQARREMRKFVRELSYTDEEAAELLERRGDGFTWKYKELGVTEKTVAVSGPGLLGFLEGFHRVRTRGDVGLWSLMFHAGNQGGRGDVFAYLDWLFLGPKGFAPVRERLKALGDRAQAAEDFDEKVRATLEALQFAEDVARALRVYRAPRSDAWWKDRGRERLTVTVPLYAQRRSEADPGIGKFTDLPETFHREREKRPGVDTVLMLPHYATVDESPYSAVSLFAVNERHVDWGDLPEVKARPELAAALVAGPAQADEVDYAALQARERPVAERSFEIFRREQLQRETDRAQDYLDFVNGQKAWLDDYARYMAVVDLKGAPPPALGYAWGGEEMQELERDGDFRRLAEFHKFAQWVGYGQLRRAATHIRASGGKVAFDVPMFRSKTGVDVWRHPRYFRARSLRDPSVTNPGVVNGWVNENWGDLALWNWTELAEEGYAFAQAPLRHWTRFGLDAARLDALHFAYDFGNGQLASGDEPGDPFAEAMARALIEEGGSPWAEAYEGKGEAAARLGFIATERNWKRLSTHDDPRYFWSSGAFERRLAEARQGKNAEGRAEGFPDATAKVFTYTLGDEPGEVVPVKSVRESADGRRSSWRFRQPRAGEAPSVWRSPSAVDDALSNAAARFVKGQGEDVEIWAASMDWFQEQWGRDTFIALPGLLLETGRFDEAKAVLRSFARREEGGLIPNRVFPDGRSEYNTVDGSLLFVHALREYLRATRDREFEEEMRRTVANVVYGYIAGTSYERMGRRHRIYVDPSDGLVVSPAQATWMDADPEGTGPITPRNGKAVEINALWYAALRFAAELESRAGNDGDAAGLNERADQVKRSFNRKFWFVTEENRRAWGGEGGALYDVVGETDEKPYFHGGAVRPNMLFAVSHAGDLLSPERQQQVLRAATADLLTPYGLRTLSPRDSNYAALYHTEQHPRDKDKAYHQGTVWPWLIGPYVDALVRVRRTQGVEEAAIRAEVRRTLTPLMEFLFLSPARSLPEVFDGGDPARPGQVQRAGGTRSQAWSVAEVLRAYKRYGEEPKPLTPSQLERWAGAAGNFLPQAASWASDGARVLARLVLPGAVRVTAAALTLGLSELKDFFADLESALRGDGEARGRYLEAVRGMGYAARARVLHGVALAHRAPFDRGRRETLLRAVESSKAPLRRVPAGGVFESRAMNFEGPEGLDFRVLLSRVPGFKDSPASYVPATVARAPDGVFEIALQDFAFELGEEALGRVVMHEVRKAYFMDSGLGPAEADRRVLAEEGGEPRAFLRLALERARNERRRADMGAWLKDAADAGPAPNDARVPDYVPMPLQEADYLAELRPKTKLGPAAGTLMQWNLDSFFFNPEADVLTDPAEVEALFAADQTASAALRLLNFRPPRERAQAARELAALNSAAKGRALRLLESAVSPLADERKREDAAELIVRTLGASARARGLAAANDARPQDALAEKLQTDFEPLLLHLLAVTADAGVRPDPELQRLLTNVYVLEFWQGHRRLDGVPDAQAYGEPRNEPARTLDVELFHWRGEDPSAPENAEVLQRFLRTVAYHRGALGRLAAHMLVDAEGDPDGAALASRLAGIAREELGVPEHEFKQARINVRGAAEALDGHEIDLGAVFDRVREDFGGTVARINIFTAEPSRFREAWRENLVWTLYMVLPDGLMTEATKHIEDSLRAIEYIKIQA
jgi:glycogen debranching enzyme